jgi:hypothetical protein
LTGVGVGEFAELQINQDKAAEAPVEEEKIDAVPLMADSQALLPRDEGKVVPQFK